MDFPRIHWRLRIGAMAICLLGAFGCAIGLNLVEQPHPGWPWQWIALLSGCLLLVACVIAILTSTLWHALAPWDATRETTP